MLIAGSSLGLSRALMGRETMRSQLRRFRQLCSYDVLLKSLICCDMQQFCPVVATGTWPGRRRAHQLSFIAKSIFARVLVSVAMAVIASDSLPCRSQYPEIRFFGVSGLEIIESTACRPQMPR